MYVDAMAMYVQIKHNDDCNDVRMITRIMVAVTSDHASS